MPDNRATEELYQLLRVLAIQSPRAARQKFAESLTVDPELAEAILQRMAAPGEGRLRQLVASFAQASLDNSRFKSHFERWLAVETDQFAQRAIAAALSIVVQKTNGPVETTEQPLVPREMVEMYRYVSEQLRHELQNAILGPQTRLLQLAVALNDCGHGPSSECGAIIAQLEDDFRSIGRMVEFDPEESYFTIRPIQVCDWLIQMNSEYGKQYTRMELSIVASDAVRAHKILASDHLLRLIFWNLWVNAHQASGPNCTVYVTCEIRDSKFVILVRDNGPGFSEEMVGVAFENRFSSRSATRGRGLLEIQDAMQKLHGQAQLVEFEPGEYRVRLTFSR